MSTLSTLKRTLAAAAVLFSTASLAAPLAVHADSLPAPRHLRYQDSDGPGLIDITPVASDPATQGFKIHVRLAQNGFVFTGSGFMLTVPTLFPAPPGVIVDPPTSDLVQFTLHDLAGHAFVFRGRISEFLGVRGGGLYERAGTGIDLDQWKVSNL